MLTFPVIPAKSGIQGLSGADITPALDSGLRRNDEIELVKPSYCQMSTLPSVSVAQPLEVKNAGELLFSMRACTRD